MSALGTRALGTRPLAGLHARGRPTVVVTAPTGVVSTAHPTVTWTYFSPLGRPQDHAYVSVVDTFGSLLALELVSGASFSHVLTYALLPNRNYFILVRAFDRPDELDSGLDDTAIATDDFASSFEVNPNVGQIYEIAINGVGLMLADDGESLKVQRKTVMIEPDRFATGDTPFSEGFDRYSLIGFDDFQGGEGQLHRDHEFSQPNRYYKSINVDPFVEPGELRLAPATEQWISHAYSNQLAVVASRGVYVLTGNSQLTHRDTHVGGTNTTFSTGNAGTVVDLATDDRHWYATDGTTIRRNHSPATPGADWSTVAVTEIEWIGTRLAGLDTAASPDNFTTFDSAGAEEVPGGRFAHDGYSLKGICAGDGFVWYGANLVGPAFENLQGQVWYWQIDSSPTVRGIALELPYGESVDNLFFYLGNVFLSTREEPGDTLKIYRCVPSQGRLTPELLLTLTNASFRGRIRFAALDRFVAFGWEHANDVTFDEMLQTAAIGVIDLDSGGYCRYVAIGPQGGFFSPKISGLVAWRGQFGAALEGQGFFGRREDLEYQDWGVLVTSSSDLASNALKTLSEVSTQFSDLNGTITVEVSPTLNHSFDSVGTVSTTGAVGISYPVDYTARSYGFKVRLDAGGADNEFTPRLHLLQAKIHPVGFADQVVMFPVNCADQLYAVVGPQIPETERGAGFKRVRFLESLVGTKIMLQDVDWPLTDTTQNYQLVNVEVETTGTPSPQEGRRVDSAIALVTLRRPL